MSYFSEVQITQHVIPDLAQSYHAPSPDANLAVNASFTGASGSSTLNVNAIQISLKTDQLCRVYIDQSGDNSNWDITDNYLYKPSESFGITVQAISAYFRIRLTNIGSTTTTFIRLDTVLCPVVEALPRSLDQYGNLRTTTIGLKDNFGFQGQYTPMRDQKICQPFRLIGTSFGSTIDTNFWSATNSGTGSAAGVSAGIATLASGTSNNGYGQITSVRDARFIFAHPNQWRGAVRIPTVTVAGNIRRWGAYSFSVPTTLIDGFYFELSSTGVLSVNSINNGGTPVSVSSGSFNGDVANYTLDNNIHAYEIIYFVMGAWFYIDNVLVHKFSPTTVPMVASYNLPSTTTSINSASGTVSGTIEVWASMILRLGNSISQPKHTWFPLGTTTGLQLKLGSGNIRNIYIGRPLNGAVITLSDSTSVATPVIWSFTANNNSPQIMDISLDNIPFRDGLRLTVSGANAEVFVAYE